MARFRFGLQKVLDYRARLVDLRSRDLAVAESRAAAVARRIAGLRAEQARCQEAPAPVDVRRWADRTAWIAELDRRIAGAEVERSAALTAVAAAREALRAAWRDREVLVQLRSRREREWAEVQRRRETAELDEIGGQRRARARRTEIAG